MPALRVLHLVGSAFDEFHCDLSLLYARDCLAATADPQRYDIYIAYITPDLQWRFPASLNAQAIEAARPMPIGEAISFLTSQQIDAAIPQMFCIPGMTHYRALLDVLRIPYVGNSSQVMSIAAHKPKTRAVVAAAGVDVPQGELLRKGDRVTLAPPTVVKPANSDNSAGVTLVRDWTGYDAALAAAFTYADEVLVESYVALGREVRCGILSRGGELIGLPLEEYCVSEQHPIRSYADKLKRGGDGDLNLMAKDSAKAWIIDLNDPITASVQAVAKRCYEAMGCRHYGLFDFRIDPQDRIWFLEAGLYCSFSPKSVVISMAQAAEIELNQLMWELLSQIVLPTASDRSAYT